MGSGSKRVQEPDEFGFDLDEESEVIYNPGKSDGRGILAVMNVHEETLMAIPGVRGVGVTKNAIGEDAIAVYVTEKAVKAKLPTSLDGYDVEALVGGKIDTT